MRGSRLALLLALALLSPAARTAAFEVRSLELETRDLVYDPVSALFYASVPSSAGPLGNSIAAIDPVTGRIRDVVWAGSEPTVLGVSGDGQYLYVGMDGAFSMRRLRLPGLAFDLDIELKGDPFRAPYSVRQIRVQPGNAHVAAVSVGSLDSNAGDSGVFVYADATRRNRGFPYGGTNFIAFSAHDPTLLYAYNNYSSEFGIRRIRIDNRGAVQLSVNGNLVQNYNVAMEHEASLLYFTNGAKVDPEANLLLGSYLPPNTYAASVLADATTGTVYFHMGDRIETYDLASFQKTGAIPLPAYAYHGVRLVRWAPERLAFRTTEGRIVFVDGRPPDADGDGVGDTIDICPALANPDQADADHDGIGDVCDAHPGSPDTPTAQCVQDLASAEQELLACVDALPYDDEDSDGERDSTDRCLGTTYRGIAVDAAGCAEWEFCRAQPLSLCKQADWKNDEAKSNNPRDCFEYGSRYSGYGCDGSGA